MSTSSQSFLFFFHTREGRCLFMSGKPTDAGQVGGSHLAAILTVVFLSVAQIVMIQTRPELNSHQFFTRHLDKRDDCLLAAKGCFFFHVRLVHDWQNLWIDVSGISCFVLVFFFAVQSRISLPCQFASFIKIDMINTRV